MITRFKIKSNFQNNLILLPFALAMIIAMSLSRLLPVIPGLYWMVNGKREQSRISTNFMNKLQT